MGFLTVLKNLDKIKANIDEKTPVTKIFWHGGRM